jgi:hypothetical protein
VYYDLAGRCITTLPYFLKWVPLERFELPTVAVETRYSNPLSYRGLNVRPAYYRCGRGRGVLRSPAKAHPHATLTVSGTPTQPFGF